MYWACGVAALGGFSWGFDSSAFGGGQILLRRYFEMGAGLFGLAVGALMFGCIAAPILAALLGDDWGSKRIMLAGAGVLLAGTLVASTSIHAGVLVSCRVLSGFGVGLLSVGCPMYIAEVSAPHQRGRLGFTYQLAIVLGSLAGLTASWVLSAALPAESAWRWMVLSTALPLTLFLVLMLRMPASPRWLFSRGLEGEALTVLTDLHGSAEARSVLDEMRRARSSVGPRASFFEGFFTPRARRLLAVGVLLAIFGNWTGWTALATYMPTLLKESGYTSPAQAVGMSIIPTLIAVVATLLAVAVVDRVGRRKLWIGASLGATLCFAALGVAFHLRVAGLGIVIMMVVASLPHAIALGALPWLMISEIFPNDVRAPAVSMCTAVLWMAGFIAVSVVPSAINLSVAWLGTSAGVWWGFAGLCLLAALFGWKLLPETKGRSLEQIGSERL